jgi:AraC-like DNA-binding protein
LDYGKAIMLQRYARELGMNATCLSTLFSRAVGVSFKSCLTELRMKRAKHLLDDPAQSASEVAAAVGYASENRFRIAFKKATGLSPKVWRETIRHRWRRETRRSGRESAHSSLSRKQPMLQRQGAKTQRRGEKPYAAYPNRLPNRALAFPKSVSRSALRLCNAIQEFVLLRKFSGARAVPAPVQKKVSGEEVEKAAVPTGASSRRHPLGAETIRPRSIQPRGRVRNRPYSGED